MSHGDLVQSKKGEVVQWYNTTPLPSASRVQGFMLIFYIENIKKFIYVYVNIVLFSV